MEGSTFSIMGDAVRGAMWRAAQVEEIAIHVCIPSSSEDTAHRYVKGISHEHTLYLGRQ